MHAFRQASNQPGVVRVTTMNRRFAYIDVLRGIACLWVLIHHALQNFPVPAGWEYAPLRALVKFATLGWLGVSLFLVLSGFCLYFPLMRHALPHTARLDVAAFAKRRARRILPPYYAALTGSVLLMVAVNAHRGHELTAGLPWTDLLRHALLLHNLWPATFASINGVLWSLALECQLYVVFPLLVYFIARRGVMAALAVAFAVSLSWQVLAYFSQGLSEHWSSDLAAWYHALPARVFEFLAGTAAAHFVMHPRPGQTRLAVVVAAVLAMPALYYAGWISRFGPLLDQLWGVIFAAGIIALSHMSNRHFEWPSPLGALNWVGGISYSVYLVHSPLFVQLRWRDPEFGATLVVALAAVKIAMAIGVGYVFFLLFERPFIVGPKPQAAQVRADREAADASSINASERA